MPGSTADHPQSTADAQSASDTDSYVNANATPDLPARLDGDLAGLQRTGQQ
jgi:hypothetical protein